MAIEFLGCSWWRVLFWLACLTPIVVLLYDARFLVFCVFAVGLFWQAEGCAPEIVEAVGE